MHRYSFGPSKTIAHPWGAFILSFITITVAVVAFLFTMNPGERGSVTLLMRGLDGVRTLGTFDVRTADVTIVETGTAVLQTREVYVDGSTAIMLDTPGLVQRVVGEAELVRVLIASPVPPPPQTPFAVWGKGERVAWVNPADGSLQVFEWNGQAYSPLRVFTDTVQSVGFSSENLLVGARIRDGQTVLSTFDLRTGSVVERATLDGLISIVVTP